MVSLFSNKNYYVIVRYYERLEPKQQQQQQQKMHATLSYDNDTVENK